MNAHLAARKNERNNPAQLKFELSLESNLWDLREEILKGTYHPSPLVCFIINHPVKREVFAPAFRDRVVSHLLYNFISPIFERTFIYDSYSCRKGKGTLFGIERAEHHARSVTNNYTQPAYGLSLDISGYFMSINRERLLSFVKSQLEKFRYRTNGGKAWDDTLDFDLIYFLLERILRRNPLKGCRLLSEAWEWDDLPKDKSLFYTLPGVGLIIGDLMSQLFSNIYLSPFDHYVKRNLHIAHYGRYVDDAFILHTDKEYLRSIIPVIQQYLKENLGLRLNMKKVHIFDITHNFKFLGACIRPYRRYPNNRTIKSFKNKVKCIERDIYNKHLSPEDLKSHRAVLNSYCGYLRKFRCWKKIRAVLGGSVINNYFYFTAGYRKAIIRKEPTYV